MEAATAAETPSIPAERAASAQYEGVNDGDMLKLLGESPIIIVFVGSKTTGEKTWRLPINLLAHCSPFFADIKEEKLSKEAPEFASLLTDHSPEAFALFVQWLYLGHITRDKDGSFVPFAQAWILGEKLGCAEFQDHAMIELLVSHWDTNIEPTTLKAAYKGSSAKSHIREWAIDQMLWDMKQGKPKQDDESWVALVKEVPDFGSYLMRASLKAGASFDDALEPYENGRDYLKVFEFFHSMESRSVDSPNPNDGSESDAFMHDSSDSDGSESEGSGSEGSKSEDKESDGNESE